MKPPALAFWRNLNLAGLLWLLSCWASFADTGLPGAENKAATNVVQLGNLIPPAGGRICAFDLEGTVLAVDAATGGLFFQDRSGAVVLNVDLANTRLQAGQVIRLCGTNYATQTGVGLSLGTQPVVNNDGLHSAAEKQGAVFLGAGQHPIQVNYFNRAVTTRLEVSYSGPDLPKQAIPNDALWQTQTATGNEASRPVQGLKYRCCEGEWSQLPNFDQLAPMRTGSVSNFDISVRTRPEYVGLKFNGFLTVPRDGNYTFYLNSDDGSQLFLASLPPRITVLGNVPIPAPTAITPGQLLPAGQNSLWAEAEGTVDFFGNEGESAQLELAADGSRMRVELLNAPQSIPPYLLHCRVRVRGICPTVRNARGQVCAGLMVANGWQSVHVLQLPTENWLASKTSTISELGSPAAAGETNGVVQLHGVLYAEPQTPTLRFKDETGSAPIAFLGGHITETGTPVDCLSQWSRNGTHLQLQQAICTAAPNRNPAADKDLPVLTTALQVQQLKPEEARRNYPVELQGVITWMMLDTDVPSLVIQDATRAVYAVTDTNLPTIDLNIGDFYKIKGVTLPGEFSPVVEVRQAALVGRGQMPRPINPTHDQLLNGSLDAQYIELRGMLTAVRDAYVTLLTPEGVFNISIAAAPDEPWRNAINAILRVRGVLFADWNKQTHRVILDHPVLRIWAATVAIDTPAPADLFKSAQMSARELMGFDAKFDPFQWVKIPGQIIHAGPDLNYMMNDGSGLRFQTATPQSFEPGDEVEVVGLVELGGASPFLRQAAARKTGHAPLPVPQQLLLDSPNSQFDSTMVWVEGTLADVKRRGDETVLEMQVGVKSFIARLTSSPSIIPKWEVGSRLKLTGVFHALSQNRMADGGVSSFELLLNSPSDVQVLARPPWWTLGRLLTIAGVLVIGLALAGVWIGLLRQQVERRTNQLRHEISQREQAEKLRAVEQERSRIARDLHDDLGSELTEISMLASPGPGMKMEPENAVERLQDIAKKSHSMISALDGVVWVVNAKNDTLSSLIEYLASNAEEFLAKAGVACRVEMPRQTYERIIPAEVRHDVLLVVREAINNAVRHGRPGRVFLRFAVSETSLEIFITDDGCGFQPNTASAGNGLNNMQDRMKKTGGQCQIASSPGQGTSVTLKLPTHFQTA